jgi:hypothetical protein
MSAPPRHLAFLHQPYTLAYQHTLREGAVQLPYARTVFLPVGLCGAVVSEIGPFVRVQIPDILVHALFPDAYFGILQELWLSC